MSFSLFSFLLFHFLYLTTPIFPSSVSCLSFLCYRLPPLPSVCRLPLYWCLVCSSLACLSLVVNYPSTNIIDLHAHYIMFPPPIFKLIITLFGAINIFRYLPVSCEKTLLSCYRENHQGGLLALVGVLQTCVLWYFPHGHVPLFIFFF